MMNERLQKFRDLALRRNEARKMNHEEVVEEDRRISLPSNWEARKQKAEWILNDQKSREIVESKGEDYDRVKLLSVSADESERLRRGKDRKKNPDTGFSTFEEATYRQYTSLTKQFQPNMKEYETAKKELGDEHFYPTQNTLILGKRKDTSEGIDRMVADLDKQVAKRSKYHRRRPYDPEAPIDFINERNKKFNKKIDRFYGPYTQDIKQDIERGTAV